MKDQVVERDERTVSVENSSYRMAYTVLSFGILISVLYRAAVLQQASWDLLALVVLGGMVATMYQGIHRILSRQWAVAALVTATIAAVVAVAIVAFKP